MPGVPGSPGGPGKPGPPGQGGAPGIPGRNGKPVNYYLHKNKSQQFQLRVLKLWIPQLQGREYSEDDLREICASVLRGT